MMVGHSFSQFFHLHFILQHCLFHHRFAAHAWKNVILVACVKDHVYNFPTSPTSVWMATALIGVRICPGCVAKVCPGSYLVLLSVNLMLCWGQGK